MIYLRYFETQSEAISANDLVAPLSCYIEEGKKALISNSKFETGRDLKIRLGSGNILEIVPKVCTVSYSSEYGTAPDPKTVNFEYSLRSGDINPIVYSGHVFKGWYIGATKIEVGYIVKDDIELIAKWD